MNKIRAALVALVGERYVTDVEPHNEHSPVIHSNDAALVDQGGSVLVKAGSTQDVAEIVKLARHYHCPLIAVGGRTGTVGGVIPLSPSILLSLERMNRIVEIDPVNMTATVEAGVILQILQEAADANGMLFPVDIGARGSATIGGVISTNAGGLCAVKYGVTRDQVVGLEAVLADGTVVSGLRKLVKDNAGYDWKHLLVGSEGTLGIVTRAVVRLRERAALPIAALIACDDFHGALQTLRRLQSATGALTTFELAWRNMYDFIVTSPVWRHRAPLAPGRAFYALIEIESSPHAMETLESALEGLMEDGLVSDAVLAQSDSQRHEIWATREDMSPLASIGPVLTYDVSVPIDAMGELADRVAADVGAKLPSARLVTFGHAGDGNLHFVVAPGIGREADGALTDEIIFGHTAALNGSISAEHGIGVHRREAMAYSRAPEEIALMRTLKKAFDPDGILNPGKVLAMETQ